MSKKVMITGVGGAIGVHLMKHLLINTDWEIVGIDSWKHKGYYDRITTMLDGELTWIKRVKIVTHDLGAPLTWRQIKDIGHIDYILNLASLSDVQNAVDDPEPFIRNNTELMLHILSYARRIWKLDGKTKPPKDAVFLHFSTDEVYGATPKDSGGHKEWEAILPSNPYSASKACQEAIAISYWRSFFLPLIITNTMNNFGETQAPSKFPAMVQKNVALGRIQDIHAAHNGEIGTRYYIHSRNTSDAILFILNNVKPLIHDSGEIDRPERLNIVGDVQLNNLELAQVIARLMGKELRHRIVYFHEQNPGHDLHYGLNGDKLAKLGWKSPVSFEDSLKQTIQWQRNNREWIGL